MSTATLAEVARLYYLRDLTQQEIADRLGISRFKVVRMLEQARADGVVRFQIEEPVAIDEGLSQALEQRFGVERAVVAQRDVARAGAQVLPSLLRPRDVVGIAWGETLGTLVDSLPLLGTRQTVVQICGAMAGVEPGAGPTEVAMRLAERLGGRCHTLPAPALPSQRGRDELVANDAVRPTVELFPRVDVAVVGIGLLPPYAGHILVHVFNDRGRITEMKRGVAMSVEQLQRAHVVAVAGGTRKRDAVRAALATGIVDTIVTDAACARHAIA